MKKTALAILGIFLLGNVGFASTPREDPQMTEFYKNLIPLIEKYNKASEQDKEAVRNEITALVSRQHDIYIARRKEMLAGSEATLSHLEKNKTANINKEIDFLVSAKGQESIQRWKESDLKHENTRAFFKNFDAFMKQYYTAAEKDKESVRRKIIDLILKNPDHWTGKITTELATRETNYAAYIQGRFKNTEFFNNFEALIEQYNTAAEKDKFSARCSITNLVINNFALPRNTKS
ncbi:MAG: hypothetical protein FWG57_00830 [Endomicrobia bacterium]|nr:hypothetical protein [Endomicrobiia bacterium]